jgi:2-iminoacetate synthase
MTLQEYLCDYASESTLAAAKGVIDAEVAKIPSERARQITAERIERIVKGERDFRF